MRVLTGPDLGVTRDENYRVCEWEGEGRVVCSYTQLGEAISAHFACDKKGLKNMKSAINDFCGWAFSLYPWCKMILAITDKASVGRLVQKCQFSHVGEFEHASVYARVK